MLAPDANDSDDSDADNYAWVGNFDFNVAPRVSITPQRELQLRHASIPVEEDLDDTVAINMTFPILTQAPVSTVSDPPMTGIDDGSLSLDGEHDLPDSYDHRAPMPTEDPHADDFEPFSFKTPTKPSYLGAKLPGTRRHMKRLATDALIIVSQKGKPSLFITATTNIEWPKFKKSCYLGKQLTIVQTLSSWYFTSVCRRCFAG